MPLDLQPVDDQGSAGKLDLQPAENSSIGKKLDYGARKAIGVGLEIASAPYEMAGEAIAAPLENRAPRATNIRREFDSSVRNEEQPADPFHAANSLMRAGAMFLTDIPSGIPAAKDAAIREYYRKPTAIDDIADLTLALGSGARTPPGMLGGEGELTIVGKMAEAPAKAMEKAFALPMKAASAIASTMLDPEMAPTAMKAMANIPKIAGEYILKDRDFLKNPYNGSKKAIDESSAKLYDTFQRYSKSEMSRASDVATVSKSLIGSGLSRLRGGIAEEEQFARESLAESRAAKKVLVTEGDRIKQILSGTDGQATPQDLFNEFSSLRKEMREHIPTSPMEAKQLTARKAIDFLSRVDQSISSKQVPGDIKATLMGIRARLPGDIKGLGISEDVIKEETQFVGDLNKTRQIYRSAVALKRPSLESLTYATEFLKNNFSRMEPKEVGRMSLELETTLANMVKWNPDYAGTSAEAFIKSRRADLDNMMKSQPGFESINEADKNFSMTKTAATRLDGSFDDPKKFEKMLRETFEDIGSRESNIKLAELRSLAERMGDPSLISDLKSEFDALDAATNKKVKFAAHFESPAAASRFIEGLFKTAEGNTVAASRLKELKKVPGMAPVIDEAMMHLSAREFKSWVGNKGLTPFEKRVLTTIVLSPVLYPFFPHAVKYLASLGVGYVGLRSPKAMRAIVRSMQGLSDVTGKMRKAGQLTPELANAMEGISRVAEPLLKGEDANLHSGLHGVSSYMEKKGEE